MATQVSTGSVLVTGTSSGMGRAVADRMATAGWRVHGGSRRAPEPHAGGRPAWTPLPLDVTSAASVEAAVAATIEAAGRLDALVHCAGISVAGAIEDISIGEVERQFATNYLGTVRMLHGVLPAMRRQGRGRIVVVGSIGGLIGLPFIGHYSASKFALDGLMQALRIEVRPFGVEATILHPGDIRTDISANQLEGERTGQGSAYHAPFRATVDAYDKAVREARPPDVVADAVLHLLARRRLPPRLIVGSPTERAGVILKAVLPPRLFELVIRSSYRL